jgi:DNA-binding Lrp family transcriptional regulator
MRGVMAMAAKAFVLIETTVGRSREVTNSLKQMGGMISVDQVTGPYDVVAVIEQPSLTEIGDLVTSKIHPIPGISRTVTCLAV